MAKLFFIVLLTLTIVVAEISAPSHAHAQNSAAKTPQATVDQAAEDKSEREDYKSPPSPELLETQNQSRSAQKLSEQQKEVRSQEGLQRSSALAAPQAKQGIANQDTQKQDIQEMPASKRAPREIAF